MEFKKKKKGQKVIALANTLKINNTTSRKLRVLLCFPVIVIQSLQCSYCPNPADKMANAIC